jgi:Niemann-Pick C1 protein
MKPQNAVVFPYSFYFVYYDQYTSIQGIAIQSILLSLGIVFVALYCLMMDLRMSFFITWCVFCMTFSQIGFIFVWNYWSHEQTSMNAVFVVNLLASIGLGVEFCVHMAHQFLFSKQQMQEYFHLTCLNHAQNAMSNVGASIISGIILTKMCGIFVLAFAPSIFFRVYFFRMYFGIVLFGFFYGMFFFPILLSWFDTCKRKKKLQKDPTNFLLSEEMDSE